MRLNISNGNHAEKSVFTKNRAPARSPSPPTSPPLVVLGTRDRLVRDARPYAAALRRAGAPLEIYSIVGGGHAVNEERPGELLPLVTAFLEST